MYNEPRKTEQPPFQQSPRWGEPGRATSSPRSEPLEQLPPWPVEHSPWQGSGTSLHDVQLSFPSLHGNDGPYLANQQYPFPPQAGLNNAPTQVQREPPQLWNGMPQTGSLQNEEVPLPGQFVYTPLNLRATYNPPDAKYDRHRKRTLITLISAIAAAALVIMGVLAFAVIGNNAANPSPGTQNVTTIAPQDTATATPVATDMPAATATTQPKPTATPIVQPTAGAGNTNPTPPPVVQPTATAAPRPPVTPTVPPTVTATPKPPPTPTPTPKTGTGKGH